MSDWGWTRSIKHVRGHAPFSLPFSPHLRPVSLVFRNTLLDSTKYQSVTSRQAPSVPVDCVVSPYCFFFRKFVIVPQIFADCSVGDCLLTSLVQGQSLLCFFLVKQCVRAQLDFLFTKLIVVLTRGRACFSC